MKTNKAFFPSRAFIYSAVFTTLVLVGLALSLHPAMAAAVSVCDVSTLRAAVGAGGTVTFGCDGAITVDNTLVISADTVLDGNGHSVILNGNGTVRVLYVNPGVTLTLNNLTIANGSSTNGGGVYNDGGILNIQNTIFTNNLALGTNSDLIGAVPAKGGAIYSQGGIMSVINSRFAGNTAQGAAGVAMEAPAAATSGGAIYTTGQLVASSNSFTGNIVRSGAGADGPSYYSWTGPGGSGAGGFGGALYVSGNTWLSANSFISNGVTGGLGGTGGHWSQPGKAGGPGGSAQGGAVYSTTGLTVLACTFAGNQALGGSGGTGGIGAPYVQGGSGGPGGVGGTGGNSFGAALAATGGTVCATNNTVYANSSRAGDGGQGGHGGDGSPQARQPGSNGGNGGNGGNTEAGLYVASATAWLVNNTIAFNTSSNSAGGAAGLGGYYGGNAGVPGTNGIASAGGLSVHSVTVNLANNILAFNGPANASGSITDSGHNLSSDSSLNFTSSGSMNNIDPLLGPLADNGGFTKTMALLNGSPAINSGDPANYPVADQRGTPRPRGPSCDIGAFEVSSLVIHKLPGTNLRLEYGGTANGHYKLQNSTDFTNWTDVVTTPASSDGLVIFEVPLDATTNQFFRLIGP